MRKVSLYIPCFNAEKTIQECLESAVKQTYPVDEILVIDDGSADNTARIASRYPVKVIRHERNKGLAAARNSAFKHARNEFVASLDADCLARGDWLEQLMRCFTEEDIAGAGGMLIERHTASSADKWRARHMSQQWGAVRNPPFLYGSNTVFKKSALAAVGMYNEIFRNNYEDVSVSALLYDKGFMLAYNPRGVAEHLRQDNVASILNNYWHWQHYRNPRALMKNGFGRRMLIALINAVDFNNCIIDMLKDDLRNKRGKLALIDIMAVFYLPWLELRESLWKQA